MAFSLKGEFLFSGDDTGNVFVYTSNEDKKYKLNQKIENMFERPVYSLVIDHLNSFLFVVD